MQPAERDGLEDEEVEGAREDARLYRVGAVLESLLEAKWGGPLLAQAPELGELVEAKEAK